jgi:peptidoglycan/LPS O-acetylase OafA/YrhL
MNKHDMDEQSIRSFASSSTLTPPPLSPISEKGFDISISTLEQHDEYSAHQTTIFTPPPRQPLSWRKTPLTPRGLTTLFLRLASPLFPSFLQSHDPSNPPPKRKLHPTSYLDGLRGVAALTVFSSHFTLHWFYALRSGYLSSETDTYILQLPILRLLFAGRAAVAIFFVISGFALSYKPLSLIRQGKIDSARGVLASSVFRRWGRLYIPIIAGTFIAMVLAWKGAYLNTPNRGEVLPSTLPGFWEQFAHWVGELKGFVFLFGRGDRGMVYNGHLWTIPVEWEGSFVVFCAVLGLSSVREGWRMGALVALGTWAVREGRWEVGCFLGGVVVAEWSLKGEEEDGLVMHSYSPEFGGNSFAGHAGSHALVRVAGKSLKALQLLCKPGLKALSLFKGPLNLFLLFVALFLLSYAGESPNPGIYHNFLIPLTPAIWESIWLGREHFWLALGALLLVFVLSNSATLQKPFISRFAQYLGDISYSLYIVHGMVLFTLGTHLQERWTGQVGKMEWVENDAGELVETLVTGTVGSGAYAAAFVACGVINIVVVFCAADAFWRVVDRRCVGWGRRVESVVSERRGR